MNRIFLLFLVMLACATVKADPVGVAAAKRVAEKILLGGKTVAEVSLDAETKGRMAVSPVDAPPFYVFSNVGAPGFAIVSGDDAFPEVIGYSLDGVLAESTEMPAALVAYLEAYSRYVADVRSGMADAPMVRTATGEREPVVGPLCTSKWGQERPFNNKCPLIGARRAPVGCVATAMAQIMYYWKYPARATGKVTYNTENSKIGIIVEDLDSDSHIYDWASMKDTKDELVSQVSQTAVAQLSYDCGVASKMGYALTGSGATDADSWHAFYTNFGYSRESTQLMFRDFVATQQEWNSLIMNELDARRPILYAGASSKGSGGDAAGHAFVFDGYDTDGNVHVNWGWNGSYDGWYSVATLDMGEYAFSEIQSMIYGIKPGFNDEKHPQNRMLVFYGSPEPRVKSVALDKAVKLYMPEFYNFDAVTRQWYVSVGLFDKYGRFIENISSNYMLEELQSYYGYMPEGDDYDYFVECKIPSVLSLSKEKLKDGDYVLRVIINEPSFKLENGQREWILPYCYGGDEANWCPVEVRDGHAYLKQVSTGMDSLDTDSDVMSVEVFGLDGRHANALKRGDVVIERQKLSDGGVRVVKKVVR